MWPLAAELNQPNTDLYFQATLIEWSLKSSLTNVLLSLFIPQIALLYYIALI